MIPQRISGLLLHPTSLPGVHGSGDLGDAAYRFVDFLSSCEQRLWQVLPLGPTGYGDSPYQSTSAFAGNPLLVSLEWLCIDGLLTSEDLATAPVFPEHLVDFEAVRRFRWDMLRRAYTRWPALVRSEQLEAFAAFRAREAAWLDDFALYIALKQVHDGAPWSAWPGELVRREPAALERWSTTLADEMALQRWVQFLFDHQWQALKSYANERGVRILGDIPIFVAHDSAEVWAHPELFFLDDDGQPIVVAGVPPDYFSATGQLWGNPLYRWEVMARDHYAWWVARLRKALQLTDLVRLDHFRGFEAYWEIPAEAESAVHGRWAPGPGKAFFDEVKRQLGELPLVAEDLGLITPEVKKLRRDIDVPGMVVLHFAFGGGADNEYLPHNLQRRCVAYTGTHDNDTTCGWFDAAGEDLRHHVRCYLGCDGNDIAWDLIRAALRSVADTVITPVQDLLGLGSAARMNTPAREQGNWSWRFREGALEDSVGLRLRELTRLFGRGRGAAQA
ncbi:MAG: 4-alpha-glucanotransferase [Pseudomonadota bacterium]